MTRNIESKTILILYLTTVSSMGDDRRGMYDGWKRNGAHTDEWWEKTSDFIERAFSLATTENVSMSEMSKCEVFSQGHIDQRPSSEWFHCRL
jgi:hypothetical protein